MQSQIDKDDAVVLDQNGVRDCSGGDTHTDTNMESSQPRPLLQDVLAEILPRGCRYVLGCVDLDLPSGKTVVKALAQLKKTVYIVHSAERIRKSYELFSDLKNVRSDTLQSSKYSELYDLLKPVNLVHMVSKAK